MHLSSMTGGVDVEGGEGSWDLPYFHHHARASAGLGMKEGRIRRGGLRRRSAPSSTGTLT
eukprot:1010914-Pyramimonas_sp.AAC.1